MGTPAAATQAECAGTHVLGAPPGFQAQFPYNAAHNRHPISPAQVLSAPFAHETAEAQRGAVLRSTELSESPQFGIPVVKF